MSNKTNEEKLRILQDRLAEIRRKKENSNINRKQEDIESEDSNQKIEILQKEKKDISFGWLKYLVIIVIFGYGAIFIFNNIRSFEFSIFSSSDKETTKPVNSEVLNKLEYNLNLQGDNIVITATFENESLAKKMVEDLKLKGYRANYFFLPNKSNSTEEVYKVFIGPYEHIEETNQWIKNLEGKIEIISL